MRLLLITFKKHLNAHDNRLTENEFKMGDFAYESSGNLKYDVLKEIPRGGFGIFVDACSKYPFCNMDYISKSSFPESGNKVRGVVSKSWVEAHMASTFDQQYLEFIMGHSTRDMAVGTLLPKFSTLDKGYRSGMFGTCHQLLAEILLDLKGIMKSLARTLLESSYDFTMTLLIHMDAEVSILLCQRLSEKKISPFYPTR